MTFTIPYRAFWQRVGSAIGLSPLWLLGLSLFLYWRNEDAVAYYMTPVLAVAGWVVISFRRAWHLVHEVHFSDEKMKIVGHTLDNRWAKEFDIKNATLEIRSQSKARREIVYYFRIKSGTQMQDINRTFQWDYTSLLSIFHEFKRIKGEKVIHDEKFYLDIMERKAKGLSSGHFDPEWTWKSK